MVVDVAALVGDGDVDLFAVRSAVRDAESEEYQRAVIGEVLIVDPDGVR